MAADITPEEYEELQMQVMQMGHLLGNIDAGKLQAFLEAISTSEATGPLFNPSLYMAANPKMQIVKRVALAIQKAKSMLPTEEETLKAQNESDREAHRMGLTPGIPLRKRNG